MWDTTCVILGEIGTTVAIARKSGDSWFIGAVTNNGEREIAFPRSFLEKGKTYLVPIFADGGEDVRTRTHVAIENILSYQYP